jgi:hypothetical protein
MAMTMKNAVFWDVTSCGSCKDRRFGGMYCNCGCWLLLTLLLARRFFRPYDGGDMLFRNVGSYKSHTASLSRRRQSSSYGCTHHCRSKFAHALDRYFSWVTIGMSAIQSLSLYDFIQFSVRNAADSVVKYTAVISFQILTYSRPFFRLAQFLNNTSHFC